MFTYEKQLIKKGFKVVIGVDEAGRAPLAGPVVAAAVYIQHFPFHNKIADSKKLSPHQREEAFKEICEKAVFGIGIMNETVIDQVNILQATFLAMTNAVRQLMFKLPAQIKAEIDFDHQVIVLVDGNRYVTSEPYPYKTIIGGDGKIVSIMCASIIAKVHRDRMLQTYDRVFPQYGFAQHKGYPTLMHKQAIKMHGLSIIHRKTFSYI